MASKLTFWNKFGRFMTPAVVLCFLLPFFGITCDGVEIVTISGTDMVGGCKPGGLAAMGDDDSGGMGGGMGGGGMGMGHHHGGGGATSKVQNVKRSPLAIAAFAMALLVSGLAWVRTRRALLASCALAFAGLATLVALYFTTTHEMKDVASQAVSKPKDEDSGGSLHFRPEHEVNVDAGARFGLWLTCLGFVGVATLTTLALREKEGASPPAPAPAPPPGASPPA